MRLHEEAAAGLKRLRPLSVVQLASYVAGANALAALGQHFNQFAADAITDCIGAQVTQSVPLRASMSGGGLSGLDRDPDGNRIARRHSSRNLGPCISYFEAHRVLDEERQRVAKEYSPWTIL